MLGITSSGCFVIGTIFGFLLASVLGIAVFFYFNPERRAESVLKMEQLWDAFKNSGDHYIKVIKEQPVPAVPKKK